MEKKKGNKEKWFKTTDDVSKKDKKPDGKKIKVPPVKAKQAKEPEPEEEKTRKSKRISSAGEPVP
jgi:hypothetical protein